MNGFLKITLGLSLIGFSFAHSAWPQSEVGPWSATTAKITNLLSLSANGRPVMTIGTNGEITMGEGYTPTEAGDAFIKALQSQLKMFCK